MKIMNIFERSVWVLFTFIASIFMTAFVFVAERVSSNQDG